MATNTVKAALQEYFPKYIKWWQTEMGSYPSVPFNADMPKAIYCGPPNEEDWAEWQPLEIKDSYDFTAAEAETGLILHADIKHYFSSYWFLELEGIYHDIHLIFDPVTPLTDPNRSIVNGWRFAARAGAAAEKIAIGTAVIEYVDSILLLFNNATGGVEWLDPEVGESGVIAASLPEIIAAMEARYQV